MMATVPHVTSGLGLRKFQADGFLLTRVYMHQYLGRLTCTREGTRLDQLWLGNRAARIEDHKARDYQHGRPL